MTKTAERKIKTLARGLRAERRRWLSGANLPWGVPWCPGPGSPSHQPPLCEGCAGREWGAERALPLAREIRRLEALLAPVVQGALW